MKRVACTIVSANYLHFAWTLAESFLKFHPNDEFHVLVVDRLPADFAPRDARVHVLEVEKLGLPEFRSLAFKFDLVELNTAVKPSFLKYLFGLGAEKAIYFDPDIYLFQPVELIYEALDASSVVLTPHILVPSPDAAHVYERDFMGTGVFNLGFVAMANTGQGLDFLDWWEERCLNFGYNDLRTGLFVDQKWVNLAPCLFDKVQILRHPGCNVAYWNLQGREISETDAGYMVNGEWPLVFFHFSGYRVKVPAQLSAYVRVEQPVNKALRSVLLYYGERVLANGVEGSQNLPYTYGHYTDGSLITTLARRLYSVSMERWKDDDPFDPRSSFYRAAKKARVLAARDQSRQYSTNNLPTDDWRVRMVNRVLFFLPRLIGGDRYTMLMKYLSYISILRNQRQLLLGPGSGGELRKLPESENR